MKDTVSVIIPVYNAEETITNTIDSLLVQTYTYYEIICIDDASQDKSNQKLKELQKRDDRIRLYKNKRRMGAAYSRNLGLEYACGEYVLFLDSDDYFASNLLEKSVECASKYNLDICIFDCRVYKNKDLVIYESHLGQSDYAEKVFNYADIKKTDVNLFLTAAWNKLIRRKFLLENDIRFQSIPSSNDVVFSMLSYSIAKKMKVLNANEALVHICTDSRKDRITNNRVPINEFLAVYRMIKEAKDRNLDDNQVELLYIKAFNLLSAQFNMPEGTGIYYYFLKNEGIDYIYEVGGDKLKKIADRFNHPLLGFKNFDFGSDWYKYVEMSLLDKNNSLWSRWNNSARVVIWGVGQYGKKVIWAAKENEKRIDYVIDSDKDKFGKEVLGYEIHQVSEQILNEADLIILSFKHVSYETKKRLEKYTADIICIDDYL